jgi:hypothetical protein
MKRSAKVPCFYSHISGSGANKKKSNSNINNDVGAGDKSGRRPSSVTLSSSSSSLMPSSFGGNGNVIGNGVMQGRPPAIDRRSNIKNGSNFVGRHRARRNGIKSIQRWWQQRFAAATRIVFAVVFFTFWGILLVRILFAFWKQRPVRFDKNHHMVAQ